jgi:hypothetical protein
MKIRSGMVSNSSSSSFMLAVKGELTQERLLDLFGVSPGSFLYSFAKEIADFFSNTRGMEEIATIADLREYYDWMSEEELQERCARKLDLLEEGWTIYLGSASDESYEGAEIWICRNGINFEKEGSLILECEGGY